MTPLAAPHSRDGKTVVRVERLRLQRQLDRARVDGLTLRVSALLALDHGRTRRDSLPGRIAP
jgi:hypothetical protein